MNNNLTLEEVIKVYQILDKNRLHKDVIRYKTFSQAKLAVDEWDSPIHSIRHIVKLEDGDFVIMGHINCEHCNYCDELIFNESLLVKETKYACSGPHTL